MNRCQASAYKDLKGKPGLGVKVGGSTRIVRDFMLDEMARLPGWVPQKDRVSTAGAKVTTPNKSTCNAQCAINWPPLMAAADAKDNGAYTVVTRDDGSKQWAYKGKPLYFWKDDKKAGDADGDGRNNVWHIAAP